MHPFNKLDIFIFTFLNLTAQTLHFIHPARYRIKYLPNHLNGINLFLSSLATQYFAYLINPDSPTLCIRLAVWTLSIYFCQVQQLRLCVSNQSQQPKIILPSSSLDDINPFWSNLAGQTLNFINPGNPGSYICLAAWTESINVSQVWQPRLRISSIFVVQYHTSVQQNQSMCLKFGSRDFIGSINLKHQTSFNFNFSRFNLQHRIPFHCCQLSYQSIQFSGYSKKINFQTISCHLGLV